MKTNETLLRVNGMKCDGCIQRAREALATVPGVIEVDFDLAAGTALVKGDADPEVIAEALTAIGYPAKPSES